MTRQRDLLLLLLCLGALPTARALSQEDALPSVYTWSPGSATEGETTPRLVSFRGGHALEFSRSRSTYLSLGHGERGILRLTGPLSLAAVVRLDSAPPEKVSLISKWHLRDGGRSYELGLTRSRQLFFTVSRSGSWPAQARELLSTRPLKTGVPYAVAAVFDPGQRMELFVNGVPSGETAADVPGAVFDSETPVYLGNRYGSEKACAFDGVIGGVWINSAAWDKELVAGWAGRQGLTEAPEPEFEVLEPPYDLEAVKARTREWYEFLQAPGWPCGAYRLTPDSPPDLYASADIAWIRWIMNDLDLTADERAEWIGFIQEQQDAGDGSYRHITGHCKTHAFCHATGALNMIGGRHRHEAALLEPYLDVQGIPRWLDRIDWVRQWGASHDIWGAGLPLVCTAGTPPEWKDAFFAWLEAEADPETGFWRRGVKARTPMEYLGGAFHIWPLYAAAGRPIPHPERVIDSVLLLQRENGSFGGGFDYGNMDGVWVLEYLAARIGHRRDEVLAALERNLLGLMKLYNESPGRFFSSAHSTESRIATLAILQGALPALFESKKPWRNPWHRPELFAVIAGER